MSEKDKLPERIAGMAFGTADLQLFQRLAELHRVSTSHVLRSCTGIGLPVSLDVNLRSKIARTAKDHATGNRAVIQAATKFGLASAQFGPRTKAEHRNERAEGERRPRAKYPRRVAGLAVSEADYEAIQRISSTRGVSDAQVVRECASIGSAIYADDELRRGIEDAALTNGVRERDVVLSAIQQGMDEAVIWLRVAPVLRIREGLRAEDPSLDRRLTEYIHAVGRRRQALRLPDPDDMDRLEVDPSWIDAAQELRYLHHAWKKNPLDEHDRLLASYLDDRHTEAEEQARRWLEARRELLELRGLDHEEDA